jgi:predicted transposase YbfD/YdcC
MTACLIPALSALTAPDKTSPQQVTERERSGLVEALSCFPDPRTARGTRYPLVGLLATAVCAVIAGATSFAAITDWLEDLDEVGRIRLGLTGRVPRASTIWRLMTRLDADLLATTLATWLAKRLKPPAGPLPRRHRIIISVDGKTMRGVHRPDGTKVHLLSALDTSTGIVIAQVTVDAKSNEIPAFTPLLDAVEQVLGSIRGLVFVADALHTQTSHANELAKRGAHLLIPVKGNQKNLFIQLKSLPWVEVPVGDRRRDQGHGRKETRTVKALTVDLPGGIHFPHVQQAIRITRTRTIKGRTTRETLYYTISLPAQEAQPADIQDWARREWLIEALHHIRDVTFSEDLSQARTGFGPAVLATLRNTAIGFHHSNGATNIAQATRRANRRSHDLIAYVTSGNLRTQ